MSSKNRQNEEKVNMELQEKQCRVKYKNCLEFVPKLGKHISNICQEAGTVSS
jgi:hypothetical protein